MPSIHTIRWIENLKDTSFELYWYDILGRGQLKTLKSVKQFLNMKKRKLPYIKGEYWLSKKNPEIYNLVRPFLENTENEILEKIIKEIKPDVVHSFEMQSCSYPIIKTMNKFSNIKWIYSCWGSDLAYYQHIKGHSEKIKSILSRINFIHTDCQRDYNIAVQLGFKGKHLGVIPGGGGYDLGMNEKYRHELKDRRYIVVKGYQHKFGRALSVIYALEKIQNQIKEFEVVVFGAHKEVDDYVKSKKLPFIVYPKDRISHSEIIEIMGKSIIYIGNSISDGMPNTLLEAMFMGAFPIQSNPENVTAEIIKHGINGFLIQNPEDIDALSGLIFSAIEDKEMLENALQTNFKISLERLDYNTNQQKIINLYKNLETNF